MKAGDFLWKIIVLLRGPRLFIMLHLAENFDVTLICTLYWIRQEDNGTLGIRITTFLLRWQFNTPGWATFLFDFRGPTLSLDYDQTLKPISLCTFLDKLHTPVLFTLDKVPTLCLIPKANKNLYYIYILIN